jgi:hypothetical protein
MSMVSGNVGFGINGTERMRIDSAGNVGIGTSSPGSRLNVSSGDETVLRISALIDGSNATPRAASLSFFGGSGNAETARIASFNRFFNLNETDMVFSTRNSGNTFVERMRIASSGNLQVSGSGANPGTTGWAGFAAGPIGSINISRNGSNVAAFFHTSNANGIDGAPVGTISITTSATSYNTSSDYRLKHDIQPMTGALAKVAQLKPVTYKWNVDDSQSQGFIAHELQEVVPECVTGEKDAVDAEGKPVYQGIDTSFLVATLTAAIQELKAELDTVKAELATLKGATE